MTLVLIASDSCCKNVNAPVIFNRKFQFGPKFSFRKKLNGKKIKAQNDLLEKSTNFFEQNDSIELTFIKFVKGAGGRRRDERN